MNDGSDFVDAEMGIRINRGRRQSWLYNTNGMTYLAWIGSGILNKPIGDFGRDGLVNFMLTTLVR